MPHKANKFKSRRRTPFVLLALLLLSTFALIVTRTSAPVHAQITSTILRRCFPYAVTAPVQNALNEAAVLLFGFSPADPADMLHHQLAYCALHKNTPPTTNVPSAPAPPTTEDPNALPIVETTHTTAALRNTAGTNKAIYIDNDTGYDVDIANLLNSPPDIQNSSNAPTVLIVHTHTTESYTPEGQSSYNAAETTRTRDKTKNVVRVGEEIARTLTDAGINVLHDTTINDYPSYNGSYTKTLGIIEWYLAHYPSIQVVLDVHRDAMSKTDGTKFKTTAEVGGEKTAQVMLVVGTNEGGLLHENWQENLKFGLHVQDKLTTLYPNLARPINLRKERFNQHATPGSVIVEVGTDGNTLSEACRAGRLFATALAAVLNQQ